MALTDNMKGAALMAASMTGFTLNDTFMKLMSSDMPLGQTVALRGVLVVILMFFVGRHLGVLRFRLQRREWGLISLRTATEVIVTYCFLTALFNMPIANVTAIIQALPLTISLAAWAFLGEPLGWRRLLAILVGLVGVLLIVQPGGAGFSVWSVYALAAVVFITLRDLIVRRMDPATPSFTVAFITAIGITLAFGVMSWGEEWGSIDVTNAALLSLAAICIIFGYLFSVMVMRVGDIGFVAPFRYTGLLVALIAGFLVFGDWPDGMTLVGVGIVVSMGIFTLYRERLVARSSVAKTPA
ncbi:DMT family transporter [Aliiroseovarius sp. KMU-50]|uniref:DMT family transporter n=1 Tax=Aliiroseovarius salicola TaxID=3009082 RepID=A0ABT4VY97_9RHOB|nr:DMT family transporter [Aliiroseovarius sp. KMU-50]MDA5093241.1 DMT family transporter [Aliiroseovarius sp. KMU-50]